MLVKNPRLPGMRFLDWAHNKSGRAKPSSPGQALPGQGETNFSDKLTMSESFPGLISSGSSGENSATLEEVVETFTHKLNNAVATILGKAQLAKMGVLKGKINDLEGKLLPALESIEAAVAKIAEAVEILQTLPGLKKDPS